MHWPTPNSPAAAGTSPGTSGGSGGDGRLGVWSGEGPQLDLHQPNFDLDERALGVGVRVLVNAVEQAASTA